MKARSQELLDRAISAMVAAIEVYNKPGFHYRAESFTVLALNAWELLLKAKWLAMHNNKLDSLYVRDNTKKQHSRYKRTRSGAPLTQNLDYLSKKLVEKKVLDAACQKNLEALMELRDTTVHFYHNKKSDFEERLQEIGMANVKNFVLSSKDWFDEDLSRFNFYPIPLSFKMPTSVETASLSKYEESFLHYLEKLSEGDSDPNSRYSVRISIELHFVRSKDANAMPVRNTDDPNALPIYLTEEQFHEKYPLTYRELVNKCRERYTNFKENSIFHRIKNDVLEDPKFAYTRYVNPKNPSSTRQTFYSTAILEELDKHYQRAKS
ncbi:MAG: DUF3644 domain-containing protein [Firmicutes bacterium]|nr:DUF3644 domain-containing protein [Bacillota bacterium]